MNPNVSFFAGLRATGKEAPVLAILDGIRDGQWRREVERVRRTAPGSEARQKAKLRLPSFTVSCETNGGGKSADAVAHSGLLQCDVDAIGQTAAEELRERLRGDPHVYAGFLSPTGTGLKVFLKIPAALETHAGAFAAAEIHFRERWGVTIDPACKDRARKNFVSFDPDIFVNESAVELPLTAPLPLPPAGEVESPPEIERPENLADSGAAREREKRNSSEPETNSYSVSSSTQQAHRFPSAELATLFHQLVRCRVGSVAPGTRNAHLVELMPFLFCAVGESVALLFAEEFHREHVAIFKDPPERTRLEAESLLRGTAQSYLAALPPETRAVYESLPETERAALRICRSLAGLEIEGLPAGSFFLSSGSLGTRINAVSMAGHRILRGFCVAGILAVETKGTRRTKGERGVATVFRFLLP